MQKDIDRLLTGCDPVVYRFVHRHLNTPTPADQQMLDAWARCGAADAGRSFRLELNDTARRTLSPLGIACLVAYARGWVSRAEDLRVAALRSVRG